MLGVVGKGTENKTEHHVLIPVLPASHQILYVVLVPVILRI